MSSHQEDNALLDGSDAEQGTGSPHKYRDTDGTDNGTCLSEIKSLMSQMAQAMVKMVDTNSAQPSTSFKCRAEGSVKKRKLMQPSDADDSDATLSEGSDGEDDMEVDSVFHSTKKSMDTDHDDGWVAEMDEPSHEEKLGPAVNDKVAILDNKKFDKPASVERMKALHGKYLPPSNADKLAVPKINPEVWGKLAYDKPMKNKDLHMMNSQKAIVAAATGMVQITDALSKAGRADPTDQIFGVKDCFKIAPDSITLLGRAHHDLSIRRCEGLRPLLKHEYVSLCSSNFPVTNKLFGKDFSKSLKEARQVALMSQNVSKHRDSPKNWGSWNWYKDKDQGKKMEQVLVQEGIWEEKVQSAKVHMQSLHLIQRLVLNVVTILNTGFNNWLMRESSFTKIRLKTLRLKN